MINHEGDLMYEDQREQQAENSLFDAIKTLCGEESI